MSSNVHIADGLAGLERGADIQLVSDVVIFAGPCCDAAFWAWYPNYKSPPESAKPQAAALMPNAA